MGIQLPLGGESRSALMCLCFIIANVSGLCVVALSKNLKLTTTLNRATTQSPCYVPLNYQTNGM